MSAVGSTHSNAGSNVDLFGKFDRRCAAKAESGAPCLKVVVNCCTDTESAATWITHGQGCCSDVAVLKS